MIWLKVIVLFALLGIVIWGFAIFIQRSLYETVAGGLKWRVPTATGLVWFVALFVPTVLNQGCGTQLPYSFNDLFMGDTRGEAGIIEFESFDVPNAQGVLERYTVTKGQRGLIAVREYRNDAGQILPPNAVTLTGITTDNKQIKFQAKLDADGFITPERIYTSDDGIVMRGEEFGRIVPRKAGQFWASAFWSLLVVAAWCGACLILAFNFGHALLFGIPLALGWLFVMNMVM